MARRGRSDAAAEVFAEGAYASLTATGVNEVKTSRDREKTDMQALNDRFADYINKVRNEYRNNKPAIIYRLCLHEDLQKSKCAKFLR